MRKWWIAGTAFVGIVTGIVIFFALRDELGTSDQVASLVGAAAGIASLLATVVLSRSRTVADDQFEVDVQERLAGIIRTQWADELAIRQIGRLAPLPQCWTVRSVELLSERDDQEGEPKRIDEYALIDIDHVVAKFQELPSKQLLITGGPGSGKSTVAAALTLGMIDSVGSHLPVVVPAASWDATTEHIHEYVIRRMREDYHFLRDRRVRETQLLERLLANGRIIPVVDGLDEMPTRSMATAILQLDRARNAGSPLIITSRTDELRLAVATHGRALSDMNTLELGPIEPESALAYLRESQKPDTANLTVIINEIERRPNGPVARALSTPLMLSLARSVYTHPSSAPRRILKCKLPSTIERELLASYVPAVYPPDGYPPLVQAEVANRGKRGYSRQDAEKWLRFLAAHLNRLDTSDLAWWELPRLIPKYVFVVAVMGSTTIVAGIAGGLSYGVVSGAASWLAFGAVTGIVSGLLAGPAIGIGIRFRVSKPIFAQRSRFLALSVDPDSVESGHLIVGRRRQVLVGIILGALIGCVAVLALAAGRWAVFHEWPVVQGAAAAGLAVGISGGLAGGVAGVLRRPIRVHERQSPRVTLRRDRVAGLSGAIIYGLGGGVALWSVGGVSVGIIAASIGAIVIGASSTAWGALITARLWFAVTGKLPLRLVAFLDDAHQRGVLRQVGSVWQFKHLMLQRQLATISPKGRTRTKS